MAEPNTTPASPGKEGDAEEMERALKKAAQQPRNDPDAHDIAADDAGGSTVGETTGG